VVGSGEPLPAGEEDIELLRERMRFMVDAVRDYTIFMLDVSGRSVLERRGRAAQGLPGG
jgi:hypothetical protein